MSLLTEDDALITTTTKKTTAPATAKSLLALALHAWTLCVLVVVLVALLLLAPAVVVMVFPVACMAASLYLLCAITVHLLEPFLIMQPDRARERRGGVRESRKQDCVEVVRAEAPGGLDDDASSAEEEHGERSEHACGREFSSSDEEGFGDSFHGEPRRFFFVDTYYKSFYDLLAFWRSLERGQWR